MNSRRFRLTLLLGGLLLTLVGLWGSVAGTNWPLAFLGATAMLFSLVPAGGKGDGE